MYALFFSRLAVGAVVAAVSGIFSIFSSLAVAEPHSKTKIAGPSFELIDQDGRAVTDAILADKPAVLHFGFTNCPVVCPTTLHEIGEHLRRLGQSADAVRFVFVTVDPERDTSATLKSYLANFDDRIIGLTGSLEQISVLANGLGATFTRTRLADGSYTMDHSVFAYLMARGWQRSGVLYMGSDARIDRVDQTLHRLMKR